MLVLYWQLCHKLAPHSVPVMSALEMQGIVLHALPRDKQSCQLEPINAMYAGLRIAYVLQVLE